MGAHDQAIAAGQRALALATASGEVVLQALAYYFLGFTYWLQGDYHRAVDYSRKTVASLDGARRRERFGLPHLPAVLSRATLAACHAELGIFAEGFAFGEEGYRIAEEDGRPGSLMVASWGAGLLALRQGDLLRALPLLERAMGLCQEADLQSGAWFSLMAPALGAVYTLSGRVADAVSLLTQALEQTMATAKAGFQALCSLTLGEAQLLAGRLEEAQVLAEGARALARAQQERSHQAYALRLLGDIAAHCTPPDVDQAAAHYHQALALADELGMRPLQAHCYRSLGTLYATVGQPEQARAELTTAVALYRAMDMTFWLPETAAVLAQVEGNRDWA
jgi:tetratricopeptide (TPR) repeat protein